MPSIRKRETTGRDGKPGKPRHQARIKLGNNHELVQTFGTKRDAEEWIATQQIMWRHGNTVDPVRGRRTAFAEWVRHWSAIYRSDLALSTVERDETVLRLHILPVFGDMPIGSIGRDSIQAWVNSLRHDVDGRPAMSSASIRKAHQLMREIMDAAVASDLIMSTPCVKIQLPAKVASIGQAVSVDKAILIGQCIHEHYADLVYTAAFTGLRFGELGALRVSDVHMATGESFVKVRQTLVDVGRHRRFLADPKTEASKREVPAPDWLMTILDRRIEHLGLGNHELMFMTPRGGPLSRRTFRMRYWGPAVEMACEFDSGVPTNLRFHDLRHSAISRWVAQGANPVQIMKWAGHTSVRTSYEIYGHTAQSEVGRVLKPFNAEIRDAVREMFEPAASVPVIHPARGGA